MVLGHPEAGEAGGQLGPSVGGEDATPQVGVVRPLVTGGEGHDHDPLTAGPGERHQAG